MRALILGAGNMGRAIRAALEARGDEVVAVVGRRSPDRAPRPDPRSLGAIDVAFEFSHASTLLENIDDALATGCHSIVVGTTGWATSETTVGGLRGRLLESNARAVVAPTFSLGAVVFADLAVEAARRFGRFTEYDPYVFEWHRRTKADRPSGTALAIANRLIPHLPSKRRACLADGQGAPDPDVLEVVALRAGSSPGMHVVGFDAPGESIELRITARDRSAYVSGALLAADRLLADPGLPAGITTVRRAGPGDRDRAACRARERSDAHRSTCDTHLTNPRRKDTPMTRTTHDRPLHIRGAFTALVSPFRRDGSLDREAFRDLVSWQLTAGIDGLVPCGTTGEAPTLTAAEREWLIGTTVELAGVRRPGRRATVIAGTGTNDTAATIAATRRAADLGADAALVVAPYYNRPDQRMLEAHYRAVADDGSLPIVVYNVPSRTGTNVEADTLLRLARHPRVVGVKEASANLDQIATILRDRPAGFSVMAGDDAWTLTVLAHGGDGVISVASNEIPAQMAALCGAVRAGDLDRARHLHERYLDLFRVNFISPNPVPVKAALAAMGRMTDMVRRPLLPLADDAGTRLVSVLRDAGLLGGLVAEPIVPEVVAIGVRQGVA